MAKRATFDTAVQTKQTQRENIEVRNNTYPQLLWNAIKVTIQSVHVTVDIREGLSSDGLVELGKEECIVQHQIVHLRQCLVTKGKQRDTNIVKTLLYPEFE